MARRRVAHRHRRRRRGAGESHQDAPYLKRWALVSRRDAGMVHVTKDVLGRDFATHTTTAMFHIPRHRKRTISLFSLQNARTITTTLLCRHSCVDTGNNKANENRDEVFDCPCNRNEPPTFLRARGWRIRSGSGCLAFRWFLSGGWATEAHRGKWRAY